MLILYLLVCPWQGFQDAWNTQAKDYQAGVHGSRTHRGPQRDPPPILKTGEPTGTHPLPQASIPQAKGLGKQGASMLIRYSFFWKVWV
ncbi:MAG: hypothetical protein DWQ07_07815 [Chloroflexi bacterium]|nr:MAG: hypothetical protein DWQ07_07815 [Chloroflexota bacterium]MBL1197055.1 hypothetical protein [Chloroflexota bacterium]